MSTPQYRGLSCTWTCLDNSSMCCSYWGVHTAGTWVGDGHVYTGEACVALHYSTWVWAAPGRVWTTVACAAPIEVSTPQKPQLQMDVSTLERPMLLLQMSTPRHRGMSCILTTVAMLLLDLYTLQRPVLYWGDLSTHWGLSFTWTCLHCRVLYRAWTCLNHTGPELHLDVSTIQSHVLHLDMSTLLG